MKRKPSKRARTKTGIIRLLPPVCRDCGKSARQTKLSNYLDFSLCSACIALREREVRSLDKSAASTTPSTKQDKRMVKKKAKTTRKTALKKTASKIASKRTASKKKKSTKIPR